MHNIVQYNVISLTHILSLKKSPCIVDDILQRQLQKDNGSPVISMWLCMCQLTEGSLLHVRTVQVYLGHSL
jgi:hypothetical protein